MNGTLLQARRFVGDKVTEKTSSSCPSCPPLSRGLQSKIYVQNCSTLFGVSRIAIDVIGHVMSSSEEASTS